MNLEERVKKHMEICKGLNELYALKNKKYGNSFSKTFQEYGPAMLCIRLDDKLQRAKRDLANYAIMGIIELEQAEGGTKDEI